MKFCIATSKYPRDFDAFIALIKDAATENGITVEGYVVVPGSRCWNHGLMLSGLPEAELARFVDALTLMLMPSRWQRVADEDPAVHAGKFEFVQG